MTNHQISISNSNSTPSCSATWLRIRSISCSTSWLEASRSDDDEIRVPIADFRAADARSLQSSLIDQHSGADAARVFEDAPGALMRQRLIGLLYDPLLLHPLGELLRVFTLQARICASRITSSSRLLSR